MKLYNHRKHTPNQWLEMILEDPLMKAEWEKFYDQYWIVKPKWGTQNNRFAKEFANTMIFYHYFPVRPKFKQGEIRLT